MKTIADFLTSNRIDESFNPIPQDLVDKLNVILSNTYVLSQTVRAVHWNLVGRNFIEVHEDLGEFYDELNSFTDQIAERLRTLNNIPISSISGMLGLSTMTEYVDHALVETDRGLILILNNLSVLQDLLHDAQKLSAIVDEGTNNMLSTIITCIEKKIWFYTSVNDGMAIETTAPTGM